MILLATLAALAGLFGTPATPETLPAVLANAPPGATIVLAPGDYATVTLRRTFSPAITIDARAAKVAGLNVDKGGGLVWQGGTLRAPGGMDGAAANGYAVRLVEARGVTIRSATITAAKKGLVIDGGGALAIQSSTFTGLREDGIIASRAAGVAITGNRFADFTPRPTTCTTADAVTYGLSQRACAALGGAWRDGHHADGIQLRNGMTGVQITGNRLVLPNAQGIGQMDTTGDAPLAQVAVSGNDVAVGQFHSITLGACSGCSVTGNAITQLTPGRKSPIRARPETRVCGNTGAAGAEAVKPC
jgi:hypothetical protein